MRSASEATGIACTGTRSARIELKLCPPCEEYKTKFFKKSCIEKHEKLELKKPEIRREVNPNC